MAVENRQKRSKKQKQQSGKSLAIIATKEVTSRNDAIRNETTYVNKKKGNDSEIFDAFIISK